MDPFSNTSTTKAPATASTVHNSKQDLILMDFSSQMYHLRQQGQVVEMSKSSNLVFEYLKVKIIESK